MSISILPVPTERQGLSGRCADWGAVSAAASSWSAALFDHGLAKGRSM